MIGNIIHQLWRSVQWICFTTLLKLDLIYILKHIRKMLSRVSDLWRKTQHLCYLRCYWKPGCLGFITIKQFICWNQCHAWLKKTYAEKHIFWCAGLVFCRVDILNKHHYKLLIPYHQCPDFVWMTGEIYMFAAQGENWLHLFTTQFLHNWANLPLL